MKQLRNRPTQIESTDFDKGVKAIQWREQSLFNKWCWNNWTTTCKKNELRHRPHSFHRN